MRKKQEKKVESEIRGRKKKNKNVRQALFFLFPFSQFG